MSKTRTIPDKIYLQIHEDGELLNNDDDVTWCKDQINSDDPGYIRQERARELEAENTALQAQLSEYEYQLEYRIEEAEKLKEAMREFCELMESPETCDFPEDFIDDYHEKFQQLLEAE